MDVTVQQFSGAQAAVPARWLPSLAAVLALAFSLLIWTEQANARLDGGLNFASDGVSTATAFDAFGSWLVPSATQANKPDGSLGGLFNRGGPIGGFAAGFIGSGLIGLLFGHGVVGELNGPAAVLGLVFQLALFVMLAWLIRAWWRDDKGAAAHLSPRQLADAYGHTRHEVLPDIGNARSDSRLGDDGEDALTPKHPCV